MRVDLSSCLSTMHDSFCETFHLKECSKNLQRVSCSYSFRPVYTTEDFWNGSCEIGTGAKKELGKRCLHYTIFTVPKIPRQNLWARLTYLGDMRSSIINKDGRRSLRAVFLKKDVSQSSTMGTEVGKNLPARMLYLKKRKKTRKLLCFLWL